MHEQSVIEELAAIRRELEKIAALLRDLGAQMD